MRGHGTSSPVLVAAVVVVLVGLAALPVFVESVRLIWAVAFCLLLPGSGWAYRADGDVVDRIALAVVISLCATILVSTAMVVSNSWSVPGGVVALAVFTLLGFVPFDRAVRSVRPNR